MSTIKHEIERLISELSEDRPLSILIPKSIIIAKKLKLAELEKWLKLELYGFLDTNPEVDKNTEVPKYRTISGLFYDVYGRPLIVKNPEYAYINEDRLPSGIAELERLAKREGEIQMMHQNRNQIIKKHFKVDVQYFSFDPSSINQVLSRIKGQLLDKITDLNIKPDIQIQKTSITKTKREELIKLLIENKLKELLEQIQKESQGNNDLEIEVILLQSRLNDLKKQQRQRTLNDQDIELRMIKLRAAILDLINE